MENKNIECPVCGSTNCIQPAKQVLSTMYDTYMACSACPPEPNIPKLEPIMCLDIPPETCKVCHKRPLDAIMGEVLTMLVEAGDRDHSATLKSVGTPLVTIGFPLAYAPRLGKDMLIIVMADVKEETAARIVDEVSQVKGIIRRTAAQDVSVGIMDTDKTPVEYELLAGCDMRCDVVSSMLGELCIYKNQSVIHIEFPRPDSPKMKIIEGAYFDGLLTGKIVADVFCGAGTLGLMAILAGAKKVILNDAWKPAIVDVILNLRVNADILGIEIEQLVDTDSLPMVAAANNMPVLVARGSGACEIEVYHGDAILLADSIECDTCLMDTFPGVSTEKFVNAWKNVAKNIVTI